MKKSRFSDSQVLAKPAWGFSDHFKLNFGVDYVRTDESRSASMQRQANRGLDTSLLGSAILSRHEER
jgi:hypothetical protein